MACQLIQKTGRKLTNTKKKKKTSKEKKGEKKGKKKEMTNSANSTKTCFKKPQSRSPWGAFPGP